MEARKIEEATFHDQLRDPLLKSRPRQYARLTANKKYYAVTRASVDFYRSWLAGRCRNARVLDYGCGDGLYACMLARHGARVVGIDISDVSIQNCRARALAEGVSESTRFRVMDAERLAFAENTFDIVCETGVLHHLDLRAAVGEISRVLRPGGSAICYEAVGHNPVFQAYRRLTPHLRTPYEARHILRMAHLPVIREFFEKVEVRFFHLFALGAVPFRNTRVFFPVLNALERLDEAVLRLPGLRLQAWVMILLLSNPKKHGMHGEPVGSCPALDSRFNAK